jgi:segregation and condensation protein A
VTDPTPDTLEFEANRTSSDPAFLVDVDGFEGPLDLLLELARRQKVDLSRISILALADQYIAFIEQARALRLELAADFLVMAAWLAFIKSRLLLPTPEARGAEPDAGQLADALATKLRRLEQIRLAAQRLMQGPQFGRDIFGRGAPEALIARVETNYEANLYDLLAAYSRQRQRHAMARVRFRPRDVWSLAEARETLQRLIGVAIEWTMLDDWLAPFCRNESERKTARASTFSASLELVREGKLQLRQSEAFAPIFLRRAEAADAERAA